MDTWDRLGQARIIPVVAIEDARDAVPTAKALLEGGIDVMEITFRTPAAPEAIWLVSEQVQDMCVGAGTVVNLEQCWRALEMGAQFIVSPGFDEETVSWCVEKQVPIVPGCVTPGEIMAALKYQLKILKFFPANVYGGLKGMKALSGPFGDVQFIPTGGVNAENLAEYLAAPYVYAVGGSWICAKKDISAGNFETIAALSREAKRIASQC